MNETISRLLERTASGWADWMLAMSWQVAVVLTVVALLCWLWRRRSASFLYVLWMLVLIRLIVPPDFAFPTGWGWWLRPTENTSETTWTIEPLAESTIAEANYVAEPVAGAPADSSHGETSVSATTHPQLQATTASLSWSLLLMLGWLGIVVARLGMLFMAALQVRGWASRAHPILDRDLVRLLDDCRRRVGIRQQVSLRNSQSCSTPLVVGLFRPVILLPSAVLERLDHEEIRAVFIHELNHVRRRDGLVNVLQAVLGTLYFFHPLVWWANSRICRLREDACDEETVLLLERRRPYGSAIIKVAEILGYAAPPLALGVLDSKTPARKRLSRILDPNLPSSNGVGWSAAFVVLAIGAVLIPCGCRPVTISIAINSHNSTTIPQPAPRTNQANAAPAEQSDGSSDRQSIESRNVDKNSNHDQGFDESDSLVVPLRYDWQLGKKYSYELYIEVPDGGSTEILSGTTVYEATDRLGDETTLAFSGRLKSRRESSSGFVVPPIGSRISPFSPFNGLSGSGTGKNHKLMIDNRGHVLEIRGDSHLPYSLGNLSQLVLDVFPDKPAQNWITTVQLPIVASNNDAIHGYRDPLARMPQRIRDRIGGLSRSRRTPRNPVVTDVASYKVKARTGELVTIEKEFERNGDQHEAGVVSPTLVGSTEIIFDLNRGVPARMRMRLAEKGSSDEQNDFVSISYRLLDETDDGTN